MAKSILDQFEEVYAADRQTWRAWLADNHTSSPGIWLVFYKKSSRQPSVSYDEAVEEALCFGWIDSKFKPIDEQRYRQVFTPRKPRSNWSRLNKQRVEKMTAQGLMTAAGLEKITAAQQDGSWTALDYIADLILPDDLAEAFDAHPAALAGYQSLPPSHKKQVLSWLHSVKNPDIRRARVAQAVESLSAGRHPISGAVIKKK